MRRDANGREGVEGIGVEFFEEGRDVEAVDEQCCTAMAVSVLEEMEELEATGIGLMYEV